MGREEVEQQIDALLDEYESAAFACGEWDVDVNDEPYEDVHAEKENVRRVVRDRLLAALRAPAGPPRETGNTGALLADAVDVLIRADNECGLESVEFLDALLELRGAHSAYLLSSSRAPGAASRDGEGQTNG